MILSLWLALVLPLIRAGHRKAAKKPHILLILADDLGYNDVPWHNPTIISPTLHQLASDGVILEKHYVQPKCAPSRAALMTGSDESHSFARKVNEHIFQGDTLSTPAANMRVFHHKCRQDSVLITDFFQRD